MKVGIVGLGRMGAAMALRLRSEGFAVSGWDRNSVANNKVAAEGIAIGRTAGAVAAETDVIISSVTEDNGVRHIFSAPDGFLSGEIAGKVFIEMSTLQPMTGRALAPLVEARGARLVEAPVLGTIPQVRAGRLLALVGGKAEDLERARPVLGKLADRIVHMGPHGSGYAMKLAANVGLGAYVQALAESLALGAAQGLALDQMLDILQQTPYASPWLKAKLDVFKGGKGDVSLDIRTLRKDIMSAVATGALSGVPMPLSAGALAALSAAIAAGHGEADLAEMPHVLREKMLQNFPGGE